MTPWTLTLTAPADFLSKNYLWHIFGSELVFDRFHTFSIIFALFGLSVSDRFGCPFSHFFTPFACCHLAAAIWSPLSKHCLFKSKSEMLDRSDLQCSREVHDICIGLGSHRTSSTPNACAALMRQTSGRSSPAHLQLMLPTWGTHIPSVATPAEPRGEKNLGSP